MLIEFCLTLTCSTPAFTFIIKSSSLLKPKTALLSPSCLMNLGIVISPALPVKFFINPSPIVLVAVNTGYVPAVPDPPNSADMIYHSQM